MKFLPLVVIFGSMNCGGMPDLVVGDSMIYLMTEKACFPSWQVEDLKIIQATAENLGLPHLLDDVEIQVYDPDVVFKNNPLIIGLYFPYSEVIKMRSTGQHVIPHELTHRAMHLLGRGYTKENEEHGPEFWSVFDWLSAGIPNRRLEKGYRCE